MSENTQRTLLDDEQNELIAGGKIKFMSDQKLGYYIYSSDEPDVHYDFGCYENMRAIKRFMATNNCDTMSDPEIIAMLQNAGLVSY